ncbi:MAG TPA: hypothetical protein VGJ09_20440 [Bryobacteraceae bacterium]
MDIHKILAELRAEKGRLEEAILTIERLAGGQSGKRRGRPPKWMASASEVTALFVTPKKRRKFSAATRKRMAESQRRRWASKKPNGQAA